MIVFELVGGNEGHPVYQDLAIANLDRQYDFLRSIVQAALALNRPVLSIEVIRALNFHAISCLHTNAGEFRPCPVQILGSPHQPPEHYRVPALMAMFVDEVNRSWGAGADPVALGAFVLWRLNWIHPFINGNGRTARVASYFVICLALGGWLPGAILLPELIAQNRPAYVAALQTADASFAAGQLDLTVLHALLSQLLGQQLASAQAQPPAASPLAPLPPPGP